MNGVRVPLFNRISGQIAVLILLSLLAIHGFITAGMYFSHARAPQGPPDNAPAQFVTVMKLIAAAESLRPYC